MNRNVLFLFLMLFIIQVSQAKNTFRKDYDYIEETDSFYKIITLHKTRNEAKVACEREGAALFSAEDESEVFELTEYWKGKQSFLHWVIVDNDKNKIRNTRGETIAGVFSNWHNGEPNNADGNEDCIALSDDETLNDVNCNKSLPFICKKMNITLQWNAECSTPYLGYKVNKIQNRCYKFHSTPRNWVDAYAICSGEQSYLAIVNNDAEAAHFANLILNSRMVPGGKTIHAGFFNRDGWNTIKGVPLHESGYNKWAQSQPDGGIGEDCGAIGSDGFLHDGDCSENKYFICEHDVVI